ncbi:MAG: type I-C CRISPR-associated protein Cas8c/Csd1 [Bacteroidales bacterium]|uniref:type I-C CRISPR-associated protein Cas8c/Csd1 n=1 Tax=Candidatus Cryptobacteroides sp. TaxID=2952915 RepID=UPI002A90EA83|nr:type I-C CRISPR-associated protein Cas8c/Csd1 [Candidatus Cryptobacteroides sp.]MDD7135989.1 type I-C CRISPR-associated protein Cas8c/Csd1 [Bacteroidales bacterium]MDY5567346.1 type I-C CRISPR-associated protein Cas8c/Csd1 [Candidatus Cryptobacteroides sp.]
MFAELVELGKRVRKGHDALKEEKCSWDIVIDKEGHFLNLIPCDITIEAENLTAKKGKARLLLDKPEETLGFDEDKHEKYIAKLAEYKDIQELSPIFYFYDKSDEVEKVRKVFLELPQAKQKGNMTFMLDSERVLSNENVRKAIKKKYEESLNIKKQGTHLCAVCGTNNYPILDEPHGSVKLPKGQTSGSMLVSYNTNAFESYNLKGNLNSGICTNCARNYIEALQYLVGNGHEITTKNGEKKFIFSNRQKISDDTLVVFWTKEPDDNINPLSDICHPTEERVRELFSSIANGDHERVNTDVENYFYCFTMSSAAARIAVRDWMAISVSQYQQNLKQWFDDIATIKDGEIFYPGINSILNNCIKPKSKPTQSDVKARARIGAILWHAALTNTHLPLLILQSALTQIEHEKTTKYCETFSPEKSTVIRLVLNRNIKKTYYMKKELDEQNESKAYLCGRLFALICQLQYKAHDGKDVNSSIRDRFFASASSNPSRAMSILLTKYVPVYQKKTKGAYTKVITEIATRIEHFPEKLTLTERGEFALGYYYQYATKKNVNSNDND